ncbi:hypothetical protein V1511DRAFT_505983 [Dipodascopsis uninucleata]
MVYRTTSMEFHSNIFKPDIFKGKTVLCTGGAGSICRRQVEALVSLGADAAIIGRRKEVTEKAATEISNARKHSKVVGYSADVRDYKSLQAAVDAAIEQLGKIDFVICGAAGNFLADFRNMSANAFKSVIDIDLLGSFNTVKACENQLIQNKGVVIFVTATLHFNGIPFQSHVAAAKAGIEAFSSTLNVELGPFGVRSICIAPGPIDQTEGVSRLIPEENRKDSIKKIPLQRYGHVNDIANATIFALSDAASFITGTTIVVDGGAWHVSQGPGITYPDGVLNSKKSGFLSPKKTKASSKL